MNIVRLVCFGILLAGAAINAMQQYTATTIVSPEQQFEFVRSIDRQAWVLTCASAVCFTAYAAGHSESLVLALGGITLSASVLESILSCLLRRRLGVD